MVSSRGIKTKIASVKNIQKITQAMQMVAASKMRKAQDRMRASQPYADKILEVVHHLALAYPEYKHPYMQEREIKRVGYIVITTDRGLCGSLNLNTLKKTVNELRQWDEKNIEQDLCVIGNKADSFFQRFNSNIVAKAKCLEEEASIRDLIGIVKVMLDAFGQYTFQIISRLTLIFTQLSLSGGSAVQEIRNAIISSMDGDFKRESVKESLEVWRAFFREYLRYVSKMKPLLRDYIPRINST